MAAHAPLEWASARSLDRQTTNTISPAGPICQRGNRRCWWATVRAAGPTGAVSRRTRIMVTLVPPRTGGGSRPPPGPGPTAAASWHGQRAAASWLATRVRADRDVAPRVPPPRTVREARRRAHTRAARPWASSRSPSPTSSRRWSNARVRY